MSNIAVYDAPTLLAAVPKLRPGIDSLHLATAEYVLTATLTLPGDVPVYGYGSTIKGKVGGTTAAPTYGRFYVPDPSSVYRDLTFNCSNVCPAVGKFGSGPDGLGANASLENLTGTNSMPGGYAMSFHNLQNSVGWNWRTRSCEKGNGMLITDGTKNLHLKGFFPTKALGHALLVTTSGGTQKTSKVFIDGGLTEGAADAAMIFEDCDTVRVRAVAFNGGGGAAAILLRTGGGRVDSNGVPVGPKGPSNVGVQDNSFQNWGAGIQSATLNNTVRDFGGNVFTAVTAQWASVIRLTPDMPGWNT